MIERRQRAIFRNLKQTLTHVFTQGAHCIQDIVGHRLKSPAGPVDHGHPGWREAGLAVGPARKFHKSMMAFNRRTTDGNAPAPAGGTTR
jgi:hypothetical protein